MKKSNKLVAFPTLLFAALLLTFEAKAGCTNVAHVKNNTPVEVTVTVHSTTKRMKPLEMTNFKTPCFAKYKIHAKLDNGVYIFKKTKFKSWPSDNDIMINYNGADIKGGEIDLGTLLTIGKIVVSIL